jgi:hypothetical protein
MSRQVLSKPVKHRFLQFRQFDLFVPDSRIFNTPATVLCAFLVGGVSVSEVFEGVVFDIVSGVPQARSLQSSQDIIESVGMRLRSIDCEAWCPLSSQGVNTIHDRCKWHVYERSFYVSQYSPNITPLRNLSFDLTDDT